MTDAFSAYGDGPSTPSSAPFAVTPHDSNQLPQIPKALYVGVGGDVVLRGVNGAADVTFRNVASGQTIDVRAAYVRATGTTASGLVGLA